MTDRHHIFLVPGFMGFAQFGADAYFDTQLWQNANAPLRQGFKAACPGVSLRITPLTTQPIGSLAERQWTLLEQIYRIADGAERIHLIGHSTGGVDAVLLTRKVTSVRWPDKEVFGGDFPRRVLAVEEPWSSEARGLIGRIRSVTTISAPLLGTGLAHALLAQLLMRFPADTLRAFLNASYWPPGPFWAQFGLAPLLAIRAGFNALTSANMAPKPFAAFLLRAVRSRDLLVDLMPEAAAARLKRNPPGDATNLAIKHIVTLPGKPGLHPHRIPGPRFLGLFATTKGGDDKNKAVDDAVALLEGVGRYVGDTPRKIDRTVNDAFVNSARQVLLDDPRAQIAAIAVADHLDVVGALGGLNEQPGLLAHIICSGSYFRDKQAFELWELLGECAGQSCC